MGSIFSKKVWRVLSSVCGTLLTVVVGFTVWSTGYRQLISGAIGGETSKVIKVEDGEEQDTEYFKDNGMSLDDWIETEAELTREVQASGTVLLKNEGGLLPLDKGSKVSAFGYGTVKTVSTGLVRFGTPGQYVDFKTGMEEDGKLKINPSLYNFYSANSSADPAFNTLNEVDVGLMTDAARADYDEYSDAAIVVLSRAGGEAGDLATGDDEEYWLKTNPYNKDMLDNLIYYGEIEPMIVVTPTWYVEDDCKGNLDPLTYSFKDELRNDLMPAVEGEYSTYAQSCDDAGFAASRSHRAFAGLSRGAVTTLHSVLNGCLDWFSRFGTFSGSRTPVEYFEEYACSEEQKGLSIDYWYLASGTFDFALSSQAEDYKAVLSIDSRLKEGENTSFDVFPMRYHSMGNWHLALYNFLIKAF